jgi:hypothetical protein
MCEATLAVPFIVDPLACVLGAVPVLSQALAVSFAIAPLTPVQTSFLAILHDAYTVLVVIQPIAIIFVSIGVFLHSFALAESCLLRVLPCVAIVAARGRSAF